MTELVLQIKNPLDLERLLPILAQLQIRYESRPVKVSKKNKSKKETILAKIQSDAFNMPNFEAFMHDFEQSRQDPPLVERD